MHLSRDGIGRGWDRGLPLLLLGREGGAGKVEDIIFYDGRLCHVMLIGMRGEHAPRNVYIRK